MVFTCFVFFVCLLFVCFRFFLWLVVFVVIFRGRGGGKLYFNVLTEEQSSTYHTIFNKPVVQYWLVR